MMQVGLLAGAVLAPSQPGCTKRSDDRSGKPGTIRPVENPAETVTPRIAYDSEEQAWFEEAVAAFHSNNAKTASGKVIRI